jgi:flagella basal body P-ring formation protein FlgA
MRTDSRHRNRAAKTDKRPVKGSIRTPPHPSAGYSEAIVKKARCTTHPMSAQPTRGRSSPRQTACGALAAVLLSPVSAASAQAEAAAGPAARSSLDIETAQAMWAPRVDAAAREAAAALAASRVPAGASAEGQTPARVSVVLGRLDPRLRLAPCREVEIYWPGNQAAWGRTRIGLRCADGSARWSVTWPLTVHVHAAAPVAASALSAGTRLQASQLQTAEVDWAAQRELPVTDPASLVGRTLKRPIAAGQPVREADLARLRWFLAGETVQVVAIGAGFQVTTDGVALNQGYDGDKVRVRTPDGKTLQGIATGRNRVEVRR